MRGRRSVASGVRFAALMLMTFMITFLVGLVAGESSGGPVPQASSSCVDTERALERVTSEMKALKETAARHLERAERAEEKYKTEAARRRAETAEVARLEELLAEARNKASADFVRMAREATAEGVKRAREFAREARPVVEDGIERLGPTLRRARAEGVKRYRKEIRRAQTKFGPYRRRIKEKMKTIDALKPYATDRHVNTAVQVVYTFFMAYVVQRALGVVYRLAFRRRKIRPVPRHVRSQSVEFRPLTPER
jgi:DNA repair exonuclease SbcCD ATPase subunit